MAKIERRTKRYPSDLTDTEWERIAPLLPRVARRGRKPRVERREILIAIRYMARSGGGWRILPKDFPPWQTVYWWFLRFIRLMLFRTIHDVVLMLDRERAGRKASPEGGVLDSETVKAPAAKERGFEGGKAAEISDSAGAQQVIAALRKRWPWMKHLFADGAYDRTQLMDKAAFLDFVVEIVRDMEAQKGFEVLPRR